jgi:diaminopropionate ammonia-lyase
MALSVAAAGAKLFGVRAVIYLAETVPEAFANQLMTAYGADVVRSGSSYEESR